MCSRKVCDIVVDRFCYFCGCGFVVLVFGLLGRVIVVLFTFDIEVSDWLRQVYLLLLLGHIVGVLCSCVSGLYFGWLEVRLGVCFAYLCLCGRLGLGCLLGVWDVVVCSFV